MSYWAVFCSAKPWVPADDADGRIASAFWEANTWHYLLAWQDWALAAPSLVRLTLDGGGHTPSTICAWPPQREYAANRNQLPCHGGKRLFILVLASLPLHQIISWEIQCRDKVHPSSALVTSSASVSRTTAIRSNSIPCTAAPS